MTRLNPMDLSFVTDNVAIKEERSPTSTVAIQFGAIDIDEQVHLALHCTRPWLTSLGGRNLRSRYHPSTPSCNICRTSTWSFLAGHQPPPSAPLSQPLSQMIRHTRLPRHLVPQNPSTASALKHVRDSTWSAPMFHLTNPIRLHTTVPSTRPRRAGEASKMSIFQD